nr:radical SAM family heme chaperone HemW [Clostridia bacterium]
MRKIGMYVHIPFCKQKCKYCDFVSFSNIDQYTEQYINCVLKEIKEISELNRINYKCGTEDLFQIDTIYIGGGTPSAISEVYIEKLVNQIKSDFELVESPEITIEVNPGTVNQKKLQKYFEIGINRLSIGLQSTDNELLHMIGRIHKYSDFEETYNLVRKIGFNNINVDLMFGLPNQSISVLEESLKRIVNKSPEHISVYSLIVEENTKIFNLIESGNLELPNEEVERKMYWKVKEILEKNEYVHYEISNFAKKGFKSRHNENCWNQCEYIGVGVAAHSYFKGIRYSNIDDVKTYIKNYETSESIHNRIFHEVQDTKQKMNEFMLLRFKKNRWYFYK